MASKHWKEHIVLPSYIGGPEEERPPFIGPSPTVVSQRRYMREYLYWATGTTQEWEDNQRSKIELSLAKSYTENGIESLSNLTFLREKKIPAFPWKAPSTKGEKSQTYMILKNKLRAGLESAALAQRLALDVSTSQAG
ncbi:hypothetical protein NW768_004046 [Fusarium equiseti]|uniref:Uncharacterized protein n=1 Tax=Fusarium equiseti TaxID=61235 RepID=A0ABQ8RJB8_FUSEQ|nr:hypothetical protein NW768_004046 [Fusarium equiseti]